MDKNLLINDIKILVEAFNSLSNMHFVDVFDANTCDLIFEKLDNRFNEYAFLERYINDNEILKEIRNLKYVRNVIKEDVIDDNF